MNVSRTGPYKAMTDASICGLGQAAANPVFSVLRFFPDDAKR
jgi:formate dehydrogenase